MTRDIKNKFDEAWADFITNNPREVWEPIHTEYINSHIKFCNQFLEALKNPSLTVL